MEKEYQFILVPYQPDKLESGMYWVSDGKVGEIRVYQLSDNDLLNSAVQEELLDRSGQFGKNFGVRKPYLICDEEPMDGDLCFHKDGWNPVVYKNGWDKKWFTKIIATPEQIGLKQCWSSNINEDNGWEEEIDLDDINDISSKGGKCKIVIDNNGNPELKHGQVIFDFTI